MIEYLSIHPLPFACDVEMRAKRASTGLEVRHQPGGSPVTSSDYNHDETTTKTKHLRGHSRKLRPPTVRLTSLNFPAPTYLVASSENKFRGHAELSIRLSNRESICKCCRCFVPVLNYYTSTYIYIMRNYAILLQQDFQVTVSSLYVNVRC